MQLHGPRTRYGKRGTLFSYTLEMGDTNLVHSATATFGARTLDIEKWAPCVRREFVEHGREIGFTVPCRWQA